MRRTIAMVLAGGKVNELAALTEMRPKSAVIFGGSYRIIDFAMTNIVEAGIGVVGILSQYRPYSLADHIAAGAPWDLVGRQRVARILSPYQAQGDTDWYRGTADALYQNIDFIERHAPDDVLIVSGDHIYRMDYRPLMELHRERRADLTLAVTPVAAPASRFGIAELDGSGRVTSYEEKPAQPRSNLASMTVYLFRREVLIEELRLSARSGRPSAFARTSTPWDRDSSPPLKTFQIYDEIIPRLVQQGRVYGVVHEGYWAYGGTLDSFLKVHEDLLGDPPPLDLGTWGIRTNTTAGAAGDPPPTRFGGDARASHSLICAGCTIDGVVERSVLSPFVVVERGAVVRDSILWHGTRVGQGAVLDRVLADKFVQVGAGARVGSGEAGQPNTEHSASLTCGAVVLGRQASLPAGIEIGRNCIIYPLVEPRDFPAAKLPCGSSLRHAPEQGQLV